MQNSPNKKQYFPKKAFGIVIIIIAFVCIATSSFKIKDDFDDDNKVAKDSVASVAAFMDVYKVLKSPRCMNCHPAGEIPLQNDDSHIHTMFPKRGKDGHGLYAMKCTNCHQPENTIGLRTPPGNPKWALPPANMKMVFENKMPRELALQIVDYNRNGHKNKEQLLEHARDTLVRWGWKPGGNRTTPPLTYPQFLKAWDTWIKTGAYAPAK